MNMRQVQQILIQMIKQKQPNQVTQTQTVQQILIQMVKLKMIFHFTVKKEYNEMQLNKLKSIKLKIEFEI